jgi:dTDP-4-dehydrorhamnose reductase
MKILITGAAGQLGQALLKAAATQGWEAVATDVAQLDITDPQAIMPHLARHRRGGECASHRVDNLETKPDLVKVNGLGRATWQWPAANWESS